MVPKSTPANDNRSPAVADIVNTTWAGSRPETTRQLANFLVEEALHAIRAKLQRNRASGADLVP